MSDPDEDKRFDDSDEPDEAEEEDSTETVPCPYCRRQIYEQAEYCPHCGNYISDEDASAPSRKPLWIVIGVVIVLAVILLCWVL